MEEILRGRSGALQAVVDVEHLGIGANEIITRIGKAISGLLYGSLGITVLKLLDTLRDLKRTDDYADMAGSVQRTLALPFGRTLVIAFGVLLLAVGLGNILRAFLDYFTRAIGSDPSLHGPIGLLARVGYFARGAAFLPAGGFIVLAGWRSRPHQALSVGHSRHAAVTSVRPSIVGGQGAGPGAFGVFGIAKAI